VLTATDLDEPSVAAAAARRIPGFDGRVVFFAETASTNDDAKRLAREGAPAGSFVVADAQTAGRGRSGARWHSPAGENLYLSIVLRPEVRASAVAPFTLVVGLVVAEVLAAKIDAPVRVKWPNDVLVRDKKIAGVLVEAQVRGDEVLSLIVGIGVNVRSTAFPPPLDRTATSLALEGERDVARADLAAEIAAGTIAATAAFAERGLAPFVERLSARDALLGAAVAAGVLRGTARGIDTEGRLVVEDARGERHVVVAGHVDKLA
jgi:BirA family biotin operon repressor/biotin-[acetyl-CoA-carboxylase] ligase